MRLFVYAIYALGDRLCFTFQSTSFELLMYAKWQCTRPRRMNIWIIQTENQTNIYIIQTEVIYLDYQAFLGNTVTWNCHKIKNSDKYKQLNKLVAQCRLDLFLHSLQAWTFLLFSVKGKFIIKLLLLIFVVVEAPEVLSHYWVAIISDRGLYLYVPLFYNAYGTCPIHSFLRSWKHCLLLLYEIVSPLKQKFWINK